MLAAVPADRLVGIKLDAVIEEAIAGQIMIDPDQVGPLRALAKLGQRGLGNPAVAQAAVERMIRSRRVPNNRSRLSQLR